MKPIKKNFIPFKNKTTHSQVKEFDSDSIYNYDPKNINFQVISYFSENRCFAAYSSDLYITCFPKTIKIKNTLTKEIIIFDNKLLRKDKNDIEEYYEYYSIKKNIKYKLRIFIS